ncbi:MAG: TraR/DksA C4-type zinc finger protein [Candidatus Eisenbacteria bacterium]
MRKRELERFERLLGEERERLQQQHDELEESARRSLRDSSGDLSAYAFHMADLGTDAMEREQNLMLAASITRTLADIADALHRIRNGDYGICDSCHRPVDVKRLQALPHARMCLACQEALDHGRNSSSGAAHP